MSNPETHTVNISVEDGEIKYRDDNNGDKSSFKVSRGDTIEWTCTNADYHFAVHIGYDSPLGKGRYPQKNNVRGISDKVSKNAPPGHYKYFVAVFDGTNIWTDDPDFIVKRRP